MLWIILLVIVIFVAYKYITGFNQKYVIANNIIIAKATYPRLSEKERRELDSYVEWLAKRSGWGDSVDDIRVEADKWRFYSLAMAEKRIPPNLDSNFVWALCKYNVAIDVRKAYGAPNFDERLEQVQPYESHMNLMRA